jgi:ABC-2 type transport system permease protein
VGDAAAKYGRSFTMGLRSSLEYRLNFLFSILSAISPVVIQTALWTRIYGPAGGDMLFGFTYAQMIGYTVVANLVGRLVRTGFEYELNGDIRGGGLDRYLVKPIGYFGYRLSVFLGGKSVQTGVTICLLAVAVGVMSRVLGFSVTVGSVIAFAVGLVVAIALTFLIFWCVGLLGFWLTEIGFLFEAVRIVIITASGGVFPLSVFGPGGEAVFKALPFWFTIQFPKELLCGRLSESSINKGINSARVLRGEWCNSSHHETCSVSGSLVYFPHP